MLIFPANIPHAGGYHWSNEFPYNRISCQITRNHKRTPLPVSNEGGKKIELEGKAYYLNEIFEKKRENEGYLVVTDTYKERYMKLQHK